MARLIGHLVVLALMLCFAYALRRRAARAFRSEPHCVACDGTDLASRGPALYRCNACGYEGGEGVAAHARSQRDECFGTLSRAQRIESATQDLLEARTLLVSGLGDLGRADAHSGLLANLITDRRGVEAAECDRALASGMGLLLEAREKARDAQAKLGTSLGVAATADLGDSDPVQDALFANWKTIGKLRRMVGQGRAMLHTVEAVLGSLQPSPRTRAREARSATA